MRTLANNNGSADAGILVVENEGIIAHAIQSSLRKAGYHVAGIAASGEEALQVLSEVRPELVLMDIHLSGEMDGIELARRITERYEIPIIYLTAHSDTETLERAKMTEPAGYLIKPVQPTSLFTSIEIALYKHRVESELRQQSAWLNTVLGSMADGVIVTDKGGRVEFLNARAEAITGWRAGEAQHKPVALILPLMDLTLKEAVDDFVLGAIARGTPTSLTSRLHSTNRGGVSFPVAGEIAPSIDDRGIAGAVITFRNATQRVKEEQEIRHEQKMLAVGRLAAGVAHDFNNLLMVILGNTDMALQSLPTGVGLVESLEEVRKAGELATNLTRNLLTFSRKQSVQPHAMNWNKVIRDHEVLCQHLLGPGIVLSTALEPELSAICADAGQMTQVLMNLVTNARDAMSNGGHLTIQTANVELHTPRAAMASTSSFVALMVKDDGSGMDAETAEHLFEPFFTTRSSGKGTGLGLSIVDGIVRELGGKIDVESAPGAGTTFTIYLPTVSNEIQAVPPAVSEPHSAGPVENRLFSNAHPA